MRASGLCPECQEPVRHALLDTGAVVVLDTDAHPDGLVWIKFLGDPPVAVIAESEGDVPASEALRYQPHRHQEEP